MLVFWTPLVNKRPSNHIIGSPPPLPSVIKYLGNWVCIYTVCNRGGGGEDRVLWRSSTGVVHCTFDQIPNLQNCFITPNKNLGGEEA